MSGSRGRRRCCRRGPARPASLPMNVAPMRKACASPSGLRLLGVLDVEAELAAVAEQRLEAVLLVRRGDHQDLADAGQHQRRQRVVDHRLVVDRQQLLADRAGQRVQPRAGSAGQDDALAHDRSVRPGSAQRDAPDGAEPLAPVAARLHGGAPAAVGEIPAHRRAQARTRSRGAASSRARARILRRVDGVAPVVAGPVGRRRS